MASVVVNGTAVAVEDAAGDVLAALTLSGGFSQLGYTNDGSGGTQLVACYAPGTRIATPSGETPIEALRIGDAVLTVAGLARPVRWIGRRSYSARIVAANPQLRPIRFRAGSLGNGLPRRDLLVSPEHAMLLDGLLIAARLLVNGHSIAAETHGADVSYLHIELAEHDVILAEGAAAESFVDDDSRNLFHNAAEYAQLYPDTDTAPARYCRSRVDRGFALEAVRRRLRAADACAA